MIGSSPGAATAGTGSGVFFPFLLADAFVDAGFLADVDGDFGDLFRGDFGDFGFSPDSPVLSVATTWPSAFNASSFLN